MGSYSRPLRRRNQKGPRSLLTRFALRLTGLVCVSYIGLQLLEKVVPSPLWRVDETSANQLLSTSPQSKIPVDFSAACLLVMDDNHFLIEWLGYHYHVMNLRRLIVTVDPRSQTSPAPVFDRWKESSLNITVWWKDSDFVPNATEFREAELWVSKRFANDNPSPALIRHRARQRLFYYHCMQEHKRNGMEYTLLTDVDEFIAVNYDTVAVRRTNNALPMAQAGSVLRLLQNERDFHRDDNTTSSPCVQIPRLRFGAVETIPLAGGWPVDVATPRSDWNASHLATLRWRKHAKVDNYPMNRISKVVVDLSRIEWEHLTPVSSIHRPVEQYCKKRKLHIRATEQLVVIHHYIGTWEQFSYRDDSRAGNERSQRMYYKAAVLNEAESDTVVPWLGGFIRDVGLDRARDLLRDAGIVSAKRTELP